MKRLPNAWVLKMSFRVSFSSDAAEELKALSKSMQLQVLKKIAHLKENPEIGKQLTNLLKNKKSLHVGKYRVVYFVQKEDVVIARIAHRSHVYE
ncbi:ParE toxin of type II toxin-antitoxin system, parDE [Candidatus Gugararchaeum adminiculabundum]|nr:ParE toxin of type II toxin-antitoxin system, parDE [Candidatus Gugararchaeum adminiculabundum]